MSCPSPSEMWLNIPTEEGIDKEVHRREATLELVHTNVCYVDAPSHRGAQYFVMFIDDYSRKLWAFVLKSKDQVPPFFKEF